uniref:Myosin tail domain-containing protein n=1 Tax=Denticeps clupeoides TaxID=299321 RepID=A0AAY4CXT4_9TELE
SKGAKLEEQRDEQTRRNITLFQAACRGYLSRQAFKKRKIQDLAIRCIQKNIKKNRGVKGWPWWKLFTNVRPLVEVQLTEEQIRGKDEEIQHLKTKLERVEKERNELRLSSDRLESRISELSAELSDERNTGESASQLLETETSKRLHIETDMKDLQTKYDTMKKQMDSMEMEVMEARLMRATELNGEMDDDDDSGGEWRLKYERAVRETEFSKKKLQQEFDDKLETEKQSKRHLERRLTDLQADHDETQRSLQQLKKKSQRVTAELQDTKLHLEGQQSRNHELEKKQRKFDTELSQAQDEVQRERSQREKLGRDKDLLTGEVFNLRQQLEDKDMELCAANLKVEQLEVELQDLSSQESKDEASLAKIKKQLRELETKVKDQEEELDEQAGTIQMLEQAKLRLEMEMERQKQSHSKELESKDEEVEEIRQSCSKKLKQMEVQLEEEYDDKQKVLREKRELESKLLTSQDQVLNQRDVETEKRLKKDLKRTKVLLADAQIMLEHVKNNAPSKREIAQLKNQLEESEFTCSTAVKARKAMELEIEDLHNQVDDITKTKMSLDEQLSRLQREKNDLQSRMEEDQEDMNELMKKHKASVSQSARDLAQITDLQAQLEESMKEKQELQEKLQSMQSQLEFQEQSMVEKSLVSRQEAKIRELDTKLEYERTQIKRLESVVARLKENLEKMTEERDLRVASENREKEQNKRMQRQIRDMKEEMTELSKKEAEASRKKHELDMDIESLEAANQSLQADLKLAFKRIGDLQAAIEDEMESDDNDDLINSGEDSDVDSEVEDRVDGVKSWLSKNKGSIKTLSEEDSLKGSSALHTPEYCINQLLLSYSAGFTCSLLCGRGKDKREKYFNSMFTVILSIICLFISHFKCRLSHAHPPSLLHFDVSLHLPLSIIFSFISYYFSSDTLRRSTSWLDNKRSNVRGPLLSSGGRSPGSVSRAESHMSLAHSSRLSEFGLRMDNDDDDDDGTSSYGSRSLVRSLSTPARPQSSEEDPSLSSGVKPAGHRNYLDPDLEKAINEVLSFKPIKFKRRSLRDSEEEGEAEAQEKQKSSQSSKSILDQEEVGGSRSRQLVLQKSKKKSRPHSESESSSNGESDRRRGSKNRGRKSHRKGSRKKKSESESESSNSESSPSSMVSYRSGGSIKKAPSRRAVGSEEEEEEAALSKKGEKQKKKKVDSLVMKYLYKPDSD